MWLQRNIALMLPDITQADLILFPLNRAQPFKISTMQIQRQLSRSHKPERTDVNTSTFALSPADIGMAISAPAQQKLTPVAVSV